MSENTRAFRKTRVGKVLSDKMASSQWKTAWHIRCIKRLSRELIS